jgi:hypothetical protein
MKLENKVKNALRKFIAQETDTYDQDDGYHKIQMAEPEFGHIIINIKEYGMEVKDNGKKAVVRPA